MSEIERLRAALRLCRHALTLNECAEDEINAAKALADHVLGEVDASDWEPGEFEKALDRALDAIGKEMKR